MKDTNQIINAFLWRFFGVLFLLFIIFRMIVSFQESTTNELGDRFDELGDRIKANSERVNSTKD